MATKRKIAPNNTFLTLKAISNLKNDAKSKSEQIEAAKSKQMNQIQAYINTRLTNIYGFDGWNMLCIDPILG